MLGIKQVRGMRCKHAGGVDRPCGLVVLCKYELTNLSRVELLYAQLLQKPQTNGIRRGGLVNQLYFIKPIWNSIEYAYTVPFVSNNMIFGSHPSAILKGYYWQFGEITR